MDKDGASEGDSRRAKYLFRVRFLIYLFRSKKISKRFGGFFGAKLRPLRRMLSSVSSKTELDRLKILIVVCVGIIFSLFLVLFPPRLPLLLHLLFFLPTSVGIPEGFFVVVVPWGSSFPQLCVFHRYLLNGCIVHLVAGVVVGCGGIWQ